MIAGRWRDKTPRRSRPWVVIFVVVVAGIEDDDSSEESKDYENVELTTREDISEFQELQEPLYEKLEGIIAEGCDGETNVIKWSQGCVTWSGGYIEEDEKPDTYVRYGL